MLTEEEEEEVEVEEDESNTQSMSPKSDMTQQNGEEPTQRESEHLFVDLFGDRTTEDSVDPIERRRRDAFLFKVRSYRLEMIKGMIEQYGVVHVKGIKKSWKKVKKIFKGIGQFCWLVCPPLPSHAITKIAFQPPRPSSYQFKIQKPQRKQDNVTKKMTGKLYDVNFTMEKDQEIETPGQQTEYFFVKSKRDNLLACVYIKSEREAKFTILLSHQNATDLGYHLFYFPGLQTIANFLDSNLCCYDYAGYGMSDGKPNEGNLYADIEAVYKSMRAKYEVDENKVILWGYSLGTAASVHLASQLEHLTGLVLTAPFCSALSIVFECDDSALCRCDQFTSIEKIHKVQAKTLICHGTEDTIIPFNHGQSLYRKCPNTVSPGFLAGAGHNDIEFFEDYWARLYKFIKYEL